MPDDYIDLSGRASRDRAKKGNSSSGLWRWAHFPAGSVFGVLFIVLSGHPWRWYVAIDAAYTVYVFWFALGLVVKDADDLLGASEILKAASRLLIPHVAALTVLTFGVSLWFHLQAVLPFWAIREGRKESLWDLFGWLVLAVAGIAQGFWMADTLKRRLGKPEV